VLRDSVADRLRRLPSKRDRGRAAGLYPRARCPTDDRKLCCAVRIVRILACGCQGQKEARRSAARTPSLLIAPESFAVLPSRDESRGSRGRTAYLTRSRCAATSLRSSLT
jgi:hypothetical protein